jgi:hypothetical protein
MTLVARADRDRSLNAMWCAYLAAAPHTASENVTKGRASVGHAILNARHYDGGRGQFLSEDPTFLAVADPNKLKQLTGQEQRALLADPQQQNSYSYGRGNPIVNKDPTGLCFEPLSAIACALTAYGVASVAVDLYDAYNTNIKYSDVFSQQEKSQTNFKLGYDVLTAATGQAAARVGLETLGPTLDALTASMDVLDTYFGKQIYKRYNDQQNPNRKKDDKAIPGASTPALNAGTGNARSSAPANMQQFPTQNANRDVARYNQLTSSVSRLVSSLSSYVSGLLKRKVQ